MKHLSKFIFTLILFIQLPISAIADNSNLTTVQSILDSNAAPEGVVFEIASWRDQYLNSALPEAKKLSRQLHDKFPDLDIAIVTHGWEQFSLTEKQLASNAPLKNTLNSLIENDIDVHVCGTHAENNDVDTEEFSKLVDVAPAGPAQINDYIKLGYVRIKI